MDFRKKIKVVSLGIILTAAFSEQLFAVPAFPGAEGPGAETVGGRGGRIIEVTNLNGSGPGSLREACEASGRRTVVFKVAGIIDLAGKPINISNPYITIAGQTAPAGGITLKNHELSIRTHDVVVRFLKMRTGTGYPLADQEGDAIGMIGKGELYNDMIDHCSLSWAHDENAQIWSWTTDTAPHDITYSWNIIAEGIDGHSTGFIAGSYSNTKDFKNIALHHNLFANTSHRLPLIKIASAKMVNNLIYNWHHYATGVKGGAHLDVIANKYKPGPETSSYKLQEITVELDGYGDINDPRSGAPGYASIYVKGNIGPHVSDESADNWPMAFHRNSDGRLPLERNVFERKTPLSKSQYPIKIESVTHAETAVLGDAGASKRINEKGEWVSSRGTVDTRIINDYKNGTGFIPASENDVGGYPTIHAGRPYADSDHDGMADVWEDMYGLDKHNYNDNAEDKDGDGYTNIEEFINGTNPGDAVNNVPPVEEPVTEEPVIEEPVIEEPSGTIKRRVSARADDAEERADGSMYLNSSDLELIYDSDNKQIVGIRFTELAIPQNAIVTKAYIQFKVDEDKFVSNTVINIHGEMGDNALPFSTAKYNISSRTRTNAFVSWSPARWDTIGEAGVDQRTSDLSSIVQEIISGSGWSEGNAMAFIITGEGKRVAESYNGDEAGAPMLYVEYTIGTTEEEPTSPLSDTTPPVITLLGSDLMHLDVGDTFSDPGATADDSNDGDLTASIETSHNVDTSVAGTYSVTYTVRDAAGNSASKSRSVIVSDPVVDTIAPVITLLGANPVNLTVGDTFTDPGATAQDNIDGNITDSIQDSSNINMDIGGTYQVTYTVSDSAGNRAEVSRNVVVSDESLELHTLQSRVSARADDAEERADGSMYLNSSDLELIYDSDKQIVGIRFTELAIPQNAIVTKAYIQFKVDEDKFVSNTVINIHGEKGDNALPFSTAKYNISSRTRTNAFVSWSPARWDTIGEAGVDQRTSDLSSIVQEIISGSGWSEGNAMAFIITGEGKRVAESYNGDKAGAPMLYVEYSY